MSALKHEGKILYLKRNNICLIKMVGAITCSNISGFDAFIKQLAADDSIEDVLIDMCITGYIDSTNLGLMAEIARLMDKKNNKKPTILSGNKRINDTIHNMGLNQVFTIVDGQEYTTGEHLVEIPEIRQNEEEKARMVLRAHKNILALGHQNELLFKDVVELLENQLNIPLHDN